VKTTQPLSVDFGKFSYPVGVCKNFGVHLVHLCSPHLFLTKITVVADNGGIVGRGVLLDYVSYAEKHSLPITPFEAYAIPISVIKAVAKDQGVAFQRGDVLFIRSGFIRAYEALSNDERKALADRASTDFAGVEASRESFQWLWENQFAAVAGDAIAFERAPVSGPKAVAETMHQWLLAGWGCPIGEMFYLEKLAEKCKDLGRWSFFMSSVPLKVPGGVASPPNAVAIF
jgi:kynurenine formamidase